MVYKFTGYLIIIGIVFVGIASAFHPITINPWGGKNELHKAANGEYWIIDHTIMLIGMFVWLIGMTIATLRLSKNKLFATIISLLFIVSLTIWLVILGMELTIFPAIFRKMSEDTHQIIGTLFFGFGLFSGYLAMVLIWIGTCCLSLIIKSIPISSKGFSMFGLIGSVIGIIGTIVTLIFPNLILLIIATALPTIWIIIFAIKLIQSNNKK